MAYKTVYLTAVKALKGTVLFASRPFLFHLSRELPFFITPYCNYNCTWQLYLHISTISCTSPSLCSALMCIELALIPINEIKNINLALLMSLFTAHYGSPEIHFRKNYGPVSSLPENWFGKEKIGDGMFEWITQLLYNPKTCLPHAKLGQSKWMVLPGFDPRTVSHTKHMTRDAKPTCIAGPSQRVGAHAFIRGVRVQL